MIALLVSLALSQAKPAGGVFPGAQAPTYKIANGKGTATLLVDQKSAKEASMAVLKFDAGAEVPEHAHDGSAEVLYVRTGKVEMVIGGTKQIAGAGDAIFIPAGTKHSAKALEASELVQVYTPSGPEQRFTQGPRVPAK